MFLCYTLRPIIRTRDMRGKVCARFSNGQELKGQSQSEVLLRRRFTPSIQLNLHGNPLGTRKGETILHGQKCIGLVQE